MSAQDSDLSESYRYFNCDILFIKKRLFKILTVWGRKFQGWWKNAVLKCYVSVDYKEQKNFSGKTLGLSKNILS